MMFKYVPDRAVTVAYNRLPTNVRWRKELADGWRKARRTNPSFARAMWRRLRGARAATVQMLLDNVFSGNGRQW